MREILFRGKQTETLWVYGSLFVNEGMYAILDDNCIKNGMFHPISVVPETVSQFTGLTDKNGKKIFEGDILKSETIFVVDFEDGSFVLRFGENGLEYAHEHYLDEMLVIGNIHDNPELLYKGGT